MKILIAEDDKDLGTILKEYLVIKGYDITLADSGTTALAIFKENHFDICIFDIMMPGMDGFSLAESVKRERSGTPFIFLTAKSLKEDKIRGLEMGADDYITKPFDPEELIVRLRNIMRRYNINSEAVITVSSTTIYCDTLKLDCCGDTSFLTIKEVQLLSYLFNHKGIVISREDILKDVWGEDDYFLGRSMDVFISRIRKYIAKDSGINLRTVRGRGFILEV